MKSGLGLVLVWTLASATAGHQELASPSEQEAVSADAGLWLVHTGALLDSLLDLFESGSRSDLTLRVQTLDLEQEEVLEVHALILTIHSPVLGHMIRLQLPDHTHSPTPELQLIESPDTTRVFRRFIRYLYTGHIAGSLDDFLPLHRLACKYNVSTLRRGLGEYMTRSLASDWPGALVMSWLEYAVQMGEAGLRDMCLQALALNLQRLLDDGQFQSLSPDLVLDLLPRSDLVLDSELDLFQALQAWIQSNEPDGLTAESALRSIRYAMIPPQELFQIQSQSAVLSRYQDSVRDLLFLSFQFHSGSALTMSRFLDLNCSLFQPRIYLSADWGGPWMLSGPLRQTRTSTLLTLLGPGGSDRSRRVLWNLELSPLWRPPPAAPGPSAAPGLPLVYTTLPPGPPVLSVTPVSGVPDLAGIQFQKSLLVVSKGNYRLCSFHHSSSENPSCLRPADLNVDHLTLHVVIRPVYQRLD